MESEIIILEECKRKLHITIPWQEWGSEWHTVVSKVKKMAQIPGFRQGKTPEAIIKSRFKDALREQFLDDYILPAIAKYWNNNKISPIDPFIKDEFSIKEEEPLSFDVDFEVDPEIKLPVCTGNTLAVKCEEWDEHVVEHALTDIQHKHATTELQDTAEMGNIATCNIKAKEGDKVISEKSRSVIEVGSKRSIFGEILVGKKKGEIFTTSHKYPDDFPDKNLTGKELAFDVEIIEIRRVILPSVDDELAKDEGYSSITELKDKVKEYMKTRYEAYIEGTKAGAIHALLLKETSPFPIPQALLAHETKHRMLKEAEELERNGINLSAPDFPWDKLKSDIEPAAERAIRLSYILNAIASEEKINVNPEEMNHYLEERAKYLGISIEQLNKKADRSYKKEIEDEILIQKTTGFLISSNKFDIEYVKANDEKDKKTITVENGQK